MAKFDDGNTTWWGIGIDKWVQLFQSVGFPTALVAFLLYVGWSYIPPVVEGHVELLKKTGQTLESMDNTLQQSNAILGEVNEVEQSTKQFMEAVQSTHGQQNDKLDTIIEQTKKQ